MTLTHGDKTLCIALQSDGSISLAIQQHPSAQEAERARHLAGVRPDRRPPTLVSLTTTSTGYPGAPRAIVTPPTREGFDFQLVGDPSLAFTFFR